MKRVKKCILAAVLCSFLTISSAACGEDSSGKSDNKSTPAPVEVSERAEDSKVVESSEEQSEESTEQSDEKSAEMSEESSRTGEAVDESWFDDAIFIGDSVTQGLCNYVENGGLGDADFLCIDCIGYQTALLGLDDEYGIHPVYNGEKVMIDDAVKAIGKKKIFIMLGMNDLSYLGVDGTVGYMTQFVDQLLEKNPDVKIYMESMIPSIASKVRDDYLTNENVALYNERLKEFCQERGYDYIDVYSQVSDGNGNLRDEICVDPMGQGHHLTYDGLQLWIDLLKRTV